MVLDVPVREGHEAPSTRWSSERGVDALVLATLAWWGYGLVRATGGRDPHALSIGLVLLACATVALRPWRLLPARSYLALLSLGAAAFAVTLVAPTGWRGASEAASWVYATQLAALCCAWASTYYKRLLLVSVTFASAGASFAMGWLAWWGGQNAAAPFIGPFYWHNQEGVFLVLGSVIAFTVLVSGEQTVRALAWVLAPLCAAGVVLTTSRASMACLGIGALAVVVLIGRAALRRSLLRLAVVIALGSACAFLLSGPPFFAHRVSPLAGTATRSASGQSLDVNGHYRLVDWQFAGRVVQHWPVTGTGFRGFRSGSKLVDPAGHGAQTPFVHNGYLQVFTDGGLLLGLPFAAVVCGVVLTVRRRPRDGVATAAVVGLLVLGLHSAIDFDWSYPVLLSAPALLVGALMAPAETPTRGRALFAAPALLLLGLATYAGWRGGMTLNAPIGGSS